MKKSLFLVIFVMSNASGVSAKDKAAQELPSSTRIAMNTIASAVVNIRREVQQPSDRSIVQDAEASRKVNKVQASHQELSDIFYNAMFL